MQLPIGLNNRYTRYENLFYYYSTASDLLITSAEYLVVETVNRFFICEKTFDILKCFQILRQARRGVMPDFGGGSTLIWRRLEPSP